MQTQVESCLGPVWAWLQIIGENSGGHLHVSFVIVGFVVEALRDYSLSTHRCYNSQIVFQTVYAAAIYDMWRCYGRNGVPIRECCDWFSSWKTSSRHSQSLFQLGSTFDFGPNRCSLNCTLWASSPTPSLNQRLSGWAFNIIAGYLHHPSSLLWWMWVWRLAKNLWK